MELRDVRQEMTAAKTNARIWAERMEWTPNKFEKAGLKKIELIRGYRSAGYLIESRNHVLLGQLGDVYLVGELNDAS